MRQSAIILFTAAVMSSCMPSCSCNGNQADENKSVQPIKVSSLADLEHDSVSLYDDGSELAPDRGVPHASESSLSATHVPTGNCAVRSSR